MTDPKMPPPMPGLLPGVPGVRRLRSPKASTLLGKSVPEVREREARPTAQFRGAKQRTNYYIDIEILHAIEELARDEGTTKTAVVKACLNMGLWAYSVLATLQPTHEQLEAALKENIPRDDYTS